MELTSLEVVNLSETYRHLRTALDRMEAIRPAGGFVEAAPPAKAAEIIEVEATDPLLRHFICRDAVLLNDMYRRFLGEPHPSMPGYSACKVRFSDPSQRYPTYAELRVAYAPNID